MSKSILICALIFTCRFAWGDFYIWYEPDGTKHVSNLPKECITEKNTVVFNCSSMITHGDPDTVAAIKEKQQLEAGFATEYRACVNDSNMCKTATYLTIDDINKANAERSDIQRAEREKIIAEREKAMKFEKLRRDELERIAEAKRNAEILSRKEQSEKAFNDRCNELRRTLGDKSNMAANMAGLGC